MSSCCSGNLKPSSLTCLQCGSSSKKVSMKTIFHQVKFPDLLKVETDHYYFCNDKLCSIGYFSQQEKIILKKQLRAFTEFQNNKICFCFDISGEQYIKSLKANTAQSIKNFVLQKTKIGDCACEIKNPSGQCCLANFKQLEKSLNKH